MDAKRRAGFTLVELLVVIAIIGILAAIAVPSIGNMKKKANIAKAKTEANALQTAIKAYQNEYHHFPLQESASDSDKRYEEDDYKNLIAVLRNDSSGGVDLAAHNPRGQVFLEIARKDMTDDQYVDPWKKPYVVICDWNFDTTIGTSEGVYEELEGVDVAVYSFGPNGVDNNGEQGRKVKDDVNSWD